MPTVLQIFKTSVTLGHFTTQQPGGVPILTLPEYQGRKILTFLPSPFHIKYNTTPGSCFFTKLCCGCCYRIIRRIENICRLEQVIEQKQRTVATVW